MSLLADAKFQEAVELHKAGRFDEAGRLYQQLIEENPNDPDLWHFKGLLALHRGNAEEAIRLITLAIVLKPNMPDYFQNIGFAYHAAGELRKAAESFNKQGNALQEQCKFGESLAAYDSALMMQPGFPPVLMNKGAALDRLGRYAEAHAAFAEGLAALPDPKEPDELMNVANALSGLGRSEEAIAAYDRLLEVEPDNATAHCSKSLLLLRLGHLAEGWREYEWRWAKQGGFKEPRGQFRQPVWQGEALDGPLLVIAEQGFGDVIQFARYVPLLAERGYDVIFETLPELTSLFREGFDHPRITVVPRIAAPLEIEGNRPFAAWVGVMSLPERFGTTLETIPAEVPYLKVDPAKVERWRQRLTSFASPSWERPTAAGRRVRVLPDKLNTLTPTLSHEGEGVRRVGIVWAGNPKNLNDFARSIPSEQILPLLAVPGVRFYSLQKGPAAEYDFNSPLPRGEGIMVKLDSGLTDFTETAAAILNLDLVIAVDTSVAHLAGALGKPVWLMIPAVVDWRWLNSGETTRWYPTMRIFRQTVRGEWGAVIEEVALALAKSPKL
jgi:Flp pilus assembly protein TadD